jgi:hypothetical protein
VISNASDRPRSAFDVGVGGGEVYARLACSASITRFTDHTLHITARFEPDTRPNLGFRMRPAARAPLLRHATGTKRAILSP